MISLVNLFKEKTLIKNYAVFLILDKQRSLNQSIGMLILILRMAKSNQLVTLLLDDLK